MDIGADYTASSEPVELVLTRHVPGLFCRQLHITDGEGNPTFSTASIGSVVNFRLRTELTDVSGNHVMLFCRKRMSWRHGWEVFRGESFEASDLVFTVEQGRRFQIRVAMKLFFANNSEKQECNYRVEGSFLTRFLKVYKGSSQVVAEMIKKPASSIKGKSYAISVDPNEDLSLIIVLLVIRHEKFRARRMNLYSMGISSVVSAVGGLFF